MTIKCIACPFLQYDGKVYTCIHKPYIHSIDMYTDTCDMSLAAIESALENLKIEYKRAEYRDTKYYKIYIKLQWIESKNPGVTCSYDGMSMRELLRTYAYNNEVCNKYRRQIAYINKYKRILNE